MVHVFHADGRGWEFNANDEFRMELWGNHARLCPDGELYLKFHDGDEYCWSTVRHSSASLAPCPLDCRASPPDRE